MTHTKQFLHLSPEELAKKISPVWWKYNFNKIITQLSPIVSPSTSPNISPLDNKNKLDADILRDELSRLNFSNNESELTEKLLQHSFLQDPGDKFLNYAKKIVNDDDVQPSLSNMSMTFLKSNFTRPSVTASISSSEKRSILTHVDPNHTDIETIKNLSLKYENSQPTLVAGTLNKELFFIELSLPCRNPKS